MSLSGDKLVAMATVKTSVATDGNTASATYVTSLTSAGVCGVAFVAPPGGKVTVLFATACYNATGSADNKTAVQIAAGAVVGSGTTFYAASDNDMILQPFTANLATRMGCFAEITGLTPGDTYNACMAHKTSAGTAHWLFRTIKVVPDL
jgi:hypothetical protein